jgi:hypothetical protein
MTKVALARIAGVVMTAVWYCDIGAFGDAETSEGGKKSARLGREAVILYDGWMVEKSA